MQLTIGGLVLEAFWPFEMCQPAQRWLQSPNPPREQAAAARLPFSFLYKHVKHLNEPKKKAGSEKLEHGTSMTAALFLSYLS